MLLLSASRFRPFPLTALSNCPLSKTTPITSPSRKSVGTGRTAPRDLPKTNQEKTQVNPTIQPSEGALHDVSVAARKQELNPFESGERFLSRKDHNPTH